MARPNLDPIAQLKDGSQLFISTTDRGERLFACQVYQCPPSDGTDPRAISEPFEARTCREAQETAYRYVMRFNVGPDIEFKKPPYLIWGGPSMPVEPDSHWRSSRYRG